MKKVFDEVGTLDKKCYTKYGLSEDILMEHAATSMLDFIQKRFKKKSKILIVSGVGDNGADGIALARLLKGGYKVKLYLPFSVKSPMAKLQLKRAKLVNIKIVDKISQCDIVVDCLFGSGLSRALDEESDKIIIKLNRLKGYKLACDIPSGINNLGQISSVAFQATKTITMGALKKSLFTDGAKDYVGKIEVANLGIQRDLYEDKSNCFLLEQKDLKLPIRGKQNTHKGTFGHLAVIVGEKKGAGLISCKTALNFGVGLITAITKRINIPNSIMSNDKLPKNITAIAIGMGLGNYKYKKEIINLKLPMIVDADMFYDKKILKLLKKENIVLTPHPKEFCNLLKICNIENITIEQLQNNRFKYIELFCKKYPKVVLLLKGANVIIGKNNKIFINTYGTSALSFGGSGDILSGLIGALLAQGYSAIDSAISGSLTHTMAALNYDGEDYSLCPNDLIQEIKKL